MSSARTHHFRNAVEKIDYLEIKESEIDSRFSFLRETITEKYEDFILQISEGVTHVESRMIFKNFQPTFCEDANECFCSGGGHVIEQIVLQSQEPELEDESVPVLEVENDRRVHGIDTFLSEVFGGNLSLASTPARFVGMGF